METPNPVDLVKQAIALEPAQKALSFVDEFRKFALERNVMDLAVGVIIGAAVGKLVESLVKHVMMPLIGTDSPRRGQLPRLEVVDRRPGDPVRAVHRRAGQLRDRGAGAVRLHREVPRLGHADADRGRSRPAPATREEALLAEIRDLLKQQPARAGGREAPALAPDSRPRHSSRPCSSAIQTICADVSASSFCLTRDW